MSGIPKKKTYTMNEWKVKINISTVLKKKYF